MRQAASDRRVFVDTSVYYALADQDDASHVAATATMRRLIEERRRFVTSNAVVFETHGLLVNRINQQAAWNVLVALRASQTIVRVRSRDEDRAEVILAQYADKDFSMTDALSFAVMERLGISVVYSLDRHFIQYGWMVVALDDERI